MKTLQELYNEIMGSDDKKKAFTEAAKNGKVNELLKAWDVEATEEEIKAFLQKKTNEQLSDDELDSVAGGGCNPNTIEVVASVMTVGFACAGIAAESYIQDGEVGKNGRICDRISHT